MSKHNRLAAIALACAGLALLASFPSSAALAQTGSATGGSDAESPGTITVTGLGKVSVTPDRATVAVRIRTTAPEIGAALEQFEGKRQIFDKVLADFADLEISSESSGPELGFNEAGQNNVFINGQRQQPETHYRVNEVVVMSMVLGEDRDASMGVIAQLVGAMAEVEILLNQDLNSNRYYSPNADRPVGPIAFVITDEAFTAAETLALERAYADAETKAKRLAGFAGGNVGRAKSITQLKPFKQKDGSPGLSTRTSSLKVSFELLP